MKASTLIHRRMSEPRWLAILTRVAEVLIFVAAVIALLSVLKPGPITLTLFMTAAQALLVIGVALYVIVSITQYKRRHGVSQVHFAAGETIFREGDAGDYLYIIIKGEVEVIREGPGQSEIVLNRLGPGEYFGEMALISNEPRNATLRTITPVDAVTMERTAFTTLCMYLPGMQEDVVQVIAEKMSKEPPTMP
jgi:Cyclic nucleotide-binding domain